MTMLAGAPYIHRGLSSSDIARHTLAALAPAIVLAVLWQGYGLLTNLLLGCVFSYSIDQLLSRWRGLSPATAALDVYTLLPAVLLALMLPPATPWWLLLVATLFAFGLVKHGFGGPGENVFHPAVAGVLFVSLAFPEEFGYWQLAADNSLGLSGLQQSLAQALGFMDGPAAYLASGARATASWLGTAPESELTALTPWLSAALLAGGLSLLWRGILGWAIPASVLTTLIICESLSTPGYGLSLPGIQLLAPAPLLLAFFVAGDASTSPASRTAQCLFGGLVSAMYFFAAMETGAAAAIAIAVIFANFWAPLLDRVCNSSGSSLRERGTVQ